MKNSHSLDGIAAALAHALQIPAPQYAAPANRTLTAFIDTVFGQQGADRVVMYNPDAIGQWVYEKYSDICADVTRRADLSLPLATVMPSVTPVCFATMYTGAQPAVHGIQKYDRPVLQIDTLFDALLRAGKRPAIVASKRCSIAKIFQEREMDYYLFDTVEEINRCAAELIREDKYDLLVIYNGNFDATMHKTGPESAASLAALQANVDAFGAFCDLIEEQWPHHNTLIGFAMDHGCHEIDDDCGSHGLDMEEDINIVHLYKGFRKDEE